MLLMPTSRLPTCSVSWPGPCPRTSADGEWTRRNSYGSRNERPSSNAISRTRDAWCNVIAVGCIGFILLPGILAFVPLATTFATHLAHSPLRHAAFRTFYAGAIGAALGYTMQTTIAAWLMATLSSSPLGVSLVQTAATAPALVFGLIGGSMADIIDRRRVILITQIVLLATTVLLGLLAIV